MIIDSKLTFDDAQAVTTAKVSANILDLGSITQGGRGTQLFINIYVNTAFSSDTETIQIDLICDTTVPTAGDTLMTILMPTAVNSIAGLHAAGLIAKVPLPSTGLDRYVGLSYVVPTAVATGKFTAFLSLD